MILCFKLLSNVTRFQYFHYIPYDCGNTEIQTDNFSAFAVILEAIALAMAKIEKI